MTTTTINWSRSLIGQLDFYWQAHLRPRLEGLTDEEYRWEPVEPCWNLRPTGDGRWRMDGEPPSPEPGPFTTIAWRMNHVAVGCFETRYRAFFGGEGPTMWAPGHRIYAAGELPGSAAEGIEYLASAYTRWRDAIAGLSEEELLTPLGEKGGPFADEPMAELVLHLNREAMHHGGEICLLRDLYRDTVASGRTGAPPGR
jgi:DinB family protein